jgi:hypothetical protein
MKLSFLPAELYLREEENRYFTVSLQGNEIFRGRSGKKAITLFNELKKKFEEEFPSHELSPDAKAEILQRTIGDELVKHNSLKTEQRKKPARSRTFG